MINKIAAILGTGLTITFLLGVTVTLNASNMITFFDILPVWIIMGAAIFMMMIEVLEIFDIHVADAMAKKFLKKK
jgi:FtsH-binding integral membrane protein